MALNLGGQIYNDRPQGRNLLLFHPVSNKYVGITGTSVIPVAAENDLLTIGGEHREGIKSFIPADLGQVAAIFINGIQIKGKPSFILMVRSKNDPFVIRHIGWCPVGLAI
jgi:hypothetical protein